MFRQSLLACMVIGLAGAAPAQEAAPPTVDQILENVVGAVGGKEALEKVSSSVSKGTFELPSMGASGTLTVYAKAPNQRLVVISIDGFGDIFQGFDGTTGWSINPQGSTEMTGQMLEDAKRDSAFHGELRIRELYPKIELKGKEKVGDREAWVLAMTPEKGNPVKTYYDAETYLMLKSTGVRVTDQGEAEVTTEMEDWRTVEGGIKAPFVIKQKLPIGDLIMKMSEVKTNVEIDDKKFSKPAN